jgi:hypothetical protein
MKKETKRWRVAIWERTVNARCVPRRFRSSPHKDLHFHFRIARRELLLFLTFCSELQAITNGTRPKAPVAESLSESFVGKLCRNRPFSMECRQSVSTKIDDKVGNESFGTSSRLSQMARPPKRAILSTIRCRMRHPLFSALTLGYRNGMFTGLNV